MTLRSMEQARRITDSVDEDFSLHANKARGQVNDPELWCSDIDFLLNEADSQMGSHGTFGGFLSTMERGGPDGGGYVDVAPPLDSVLGTSIQCAAGLAEGVVARERRLRPVFERLPRETRAIHVARYRTLNEQSTPPGAVGQLGYLVGVVFLAHDGKTVGKILEACQKSSKFGTRKGEQAGQPPVIRRALQVAEGLVRAAHRQYYVLARSA